MIEKNPQQRIKLIEIIRSKWINKNHKISLEQEIENDLKQHQTSLK